MSQTLEEIESKIKELKQTIEELKGSSTKIAEYEQRIRELEGELTLWHKHIAERTEYSYCPYCGREL